MLMKRWYYDIDGDKKYIDMPLSTAATHAAEDAWATHCDKTRQYKDGHVTIWSDKDPQQTFEVVVDVRAVYGASLVKKE